MLRSAASPGSRGVRPARERRGSGLLKPSLSAGHLTKRPPSSAPAPVTARGGRRPPGGTPLHVYLLQHPSAVRVERDRLQQETRAHGLSHDADRAIKRKI